MSEKTPTKSPKLGNVYRTKTVDMQRELYRDWADTYEADSVGEFGYVGFETAAKEFASRVAEKNAKVLDAGCGTGLSGVALKNQGYANLHGIDLSPEMLTKAEATGAYQSVEVADLTQALQVGPFDAVFASGVFGFGPPHPEHLGILVNTLKSGGLAVLTVNGKGWDECGWDEKFPKELEKQSLNLVEQVEIPYLEIEEIRGILLVFQA